jgi:alpha/beta superfamily hydrolase
VNDIRANTVLPARRTDIELHTEDGLTLVGELAVPEIAPPAATMICLHPLPTHGGMMDSQVFRKAGWRLPALADIAVLRFNTRGTSSQRGTSEGVFDEGRAEGHDVVAAIRYALDAGLPRVWLVGWSFGTELTLKYGLVAGVVGAVLLSPPLRRTTDAELSAWGADGRPLAALIPEFDDYLRPEEARERFAVVPQAEVVTISGGRHLWVGQLPTALQEIVKRVNPQRYPLPESY